MPLNIPRIGRALTRPAVGPANRPPPTGGRSGTARGGRVVGYAAMPAEWQEIGPVKRRASVKLDANGAGSVSFSVFSANHRWLIYEVVCKAAGNMPGIFPQVTLHIGGQAQDGLSEGGSWTGGQETFQGQVVMDACDDLSADFASGTAGTVVTVIINGVNYLWR